MNELTEEIDPVFGVAVRITRLKSPLNIHFRLYLNFYNDEDVKVAYVWVAYNMHEQNNPANVDAPVRIHETRNNIGCSSRSPSIITENVVADNIVFKVARESLVIADKTVVDLSGFTCYAQIGWKDLVSVGSVSKMKLNLHQIIDEDFGEPTSDYLSFSYTTLSGNYINLNIHSLVPNVF